jgi:hypothetical protein
MTRRPCQWPVSPCSVVELDADRRIGLRLHRRLPIGELAARRVRRIQLLQHMKGILIAAEPDMQPVFEIAPEGIPSARRLAGKPSAERVDGDVVLVAQGLGLG